MWQISLQTFFARVIENFAGPQTRLSGKDVGDLISSPDEKLTVSAILLHRMSPQV
jgi:hypothetical protein